MTRSRIDWSHVEIVFVRRIACPHCGSTRSPLLVRSVAGGDGSIARKAICKCCSWPFLIVVEDGEDAPPENGNWGDDEV